MISGNDSKGGLSGRKFAYVRVSTKDQCVDRQVDAMKREGLTDDQIVIEHQSGKDFERPLYKALVKELKAGDTLYIKSIDRLGRNYEMIIEQWKWLTKDKGVGIIVLDMPILNTGTVNDLTRQLISDIVLQLLSYVAAEERQHIRQRVIEGLAAARARGARFGRPCLERSEEFYRLATMHLSGKISGRKAVKQLGISHTCFQNWLREI